ncbi:MAG: hypothetical protein JKX72_07680 [Robiginitomaculum sp.]|nr:hypothetical protein [Robiginitomaculum sp.]
MSVDEIIFEFDALCNDDEFSRSISLIRAYSFDRLARTILEIEQQEAIKLIIEAELEKFQ